MPFLPDFSQATFIPNDPIDNNYLPMVPGTVSAFAGSDGETVEANDFYVTSLKFEVLGVETFVIRDTAYEDGLLIEETCDFIAQDSDGNVWYFGEIVINYRYDEDGNFLGTDSDGAWLAGEDDAQPGWLMPDRPVRDFSWYNEHAPDVALDRTRALGRHHRIDTQLGELEVLKTQDKTELEPGVREFKYYAQGIGLVRVEEDLDASGEPGLVIELTDTITAGSSLPPAGASRIDADDFAGDGSTRWVTFLGEDGEHSGAIGYYTYDLATGEIGEGRILSADLANAAAGDAFKIKGVGAGQGIGLFFVPNAAELGVDLADYKAGGLFFQNMLTGDAATLSDRMAPVVFDGGGNPLPISIFHALGAAHQANLLNPGLGLQAVEWLPFDDDVVEIGFEDHRQTEQGFDADFDDFRFAFADAPVDPTDFVVPPEAAFGGRATEATPPAIAVGWIDRAGALPEAESWLA